MVWTAAVDRQPSANNRGDPWAYDQRVKGGDRAPVPVEMNTKKKALAGLETRNHLVPLQVRVWRMAGAGYPGHQSSPEHGMASRFRRRSAAS